MTEFVVGILKKGDFDNKMLIMRAHQTLFCCCGIAVIREKPCICKITRLQNSGGTENVLFHSTLLISLTTLFFLLYHLSVIFSICFLSLPPTFIGLISVFALVHYFICTYPLSLSLSRSLFLSFSLLVCTVLTDPNSSEAALVKRVF